jgi:hypothetical protein
MPGESSAAEETAQAGPGQNITRLLRAPKTHPGPVMRPTPLEAPKYA